MPKQVILSDAVFARLRALAAVRVETESTVIERLLDHYEGARQKAEEMRAPKIPRPKLRPAISPRRTTLNFPTVERVTSGSLSEPYLQGLLLVSLLELGGVAETKDVIAEMKRYLQAHSDLTPRDVAVNTEENGWERWETSARYTRKHLVDSGQLRSGGPRGIWALTAAGTEEAEQLEARCR